MKRKRKSAVRAAIGTRDRVRVTLDLSRDGHRRLEALARTANVSNATALRQALQLFEFVVKRTAEGCRFKKVEKDGRESEIQFIGYVDL
jgi:hypothetical protein